MSASRGRRLVLTGIVLATVLLPLPTMSLPPVARGALELLPPVGVADTLTMVHDRTAVVPPPGVLGNDLDLGGGATAVLDSPPSRGTVTLRSDGGYTYKPKAGYVGTDEFWYHATSNSLDSLSTPVSITITNVPPVAVDDAYSGTTGKPLVVPAPGVLSNDTDADGDPLRAELKGGISNGSIDLDPDGGFVYDPGDFTGVTSFSYRVWDGAAWSLEATVVITMLPEAPLPSLDPSPLPSLDPSPLPSLDPSPLPPILPTPKPTPRPTPTPTATAVPTPTPTPTPSPDPTGAGASPSSSPVPAGPGSGGPDGGPPTPDGDAFALPPVQIDPFDDRLGGFDAFGGFEWAVPAMVLAVPGLLLIVAILAEAAIGVVWLPMVRRHLAGLGIRRPRRQPARS